MKTQIIQIGNSQGVRIPKILLEESKISGDVELELHEEGILIRNVQKPRKNWDSVFKKLAENDDEESHSFDSATDFEKKEWQW
jgi:antitoxin MazE